MTNIHMDCSGRREVPKKRKLRPASPDTGCRKVGAVTVFGKEERRKETRQGGASCGEERQSRRRLHGRLAPAGTPEEAFAIRLDTWGSSLPRGIFDVNPPVFISRAFTRQRRRRIEISETPFARQRFFHRNGKYRFPMKQLYNGACGSSPFAQKPRSRRKAPGGKICRRIP